MITVKRLETVEWLLGLTVISTSLVVWWQARRPFNGELQAYDLFPLFGLVAFGLMWTHFISGALRRLWLVAQPQKTYETTSAYIILGCIIAHPVLLQVALWRDGFGVPPVSYLTAYGGTTGLNAALFAGTITLGLFLLYELRRWLEVRWWRRLVMWLQVPAMIMIFFHGLTLGGELAIGWYHVLWWLYGLTLLLAIGYSMYHDIDNKEGAYAINKSK